MSEIKAQSGACAGDDRSGRHPRRGLILRLAFTIALLAVLATQINLREVGSLFLELHWGFLSIALALAFLDRVLATIRWWVLLQVKKVPIPLGQLFMLHLHASFLGGFMPTSFSVDAVRIALSARATGRTVDCIASSIVDRLMMMVCTFAVAVPMAFLLAESLLPSGARWVILGGFIFLIAGVAGFLLTSRTCAAKAGASLAKRTLGDRIASKAAILYWAMHEFHRSRAAMLTGFGVTVLILAVRFLFMVTLAWAVRADPELAALVILTPVIWVVLMAPVSVGGFGLQEVMYAAFLSAAGIAATTAVAMSLVEHVLVRAVSLPGAIMWIFAGYRKPVPQGDATAAGSISTVVPNLQR